MMEREDMDSTSRRMGMPTLRALTIVACAMAPACDAPVRGAGDAGKSLRDLSFAFPSDDLKAAPVADLANESGDDGGTVEPFGEPCGEIQGPYLPGLPFSGSVSFVRPRPGNPNQDQRASPTAPIFPNVLA